MFARTDIILAVCSALRTDFAVVEKFATNCDRALKTALEKATVRPLKPVGCELNAISRLQCQSSDAAAGNAEIGKIAVGEHREFVIRRAIDAPSGQRVAYLVPFLLKICAAGIQNCVQPTA